MDYTDPVTGERKRPKLDLPAKTSKADAFAAAQIVYDELSRHASDGISQFQQSKPLSELLTEHRARPGISEWTREIEEKQAKNINRILPSITVTDITTAMLDDYASDRKLEPARARAAGDATVLKELKLIRQAVRWGFDRDLCGPVTFKFPRLAPEHRKARFLSPDDLNKLFTACGKDTDFMRQATEFMYLTGLRRLEMFSLKWVNIDFTNSKMQLTTQKSGRSAVKRTDTVFLSPRAIKLLKQRKTEAIGAFVWGVSDGILRNGKQTHEPFDFRRRLVIRAKQAGLPPGVTVHTMRHSCATNLLGVGTTVPEAAAHLRHRDGGALLLRTYAHAHESALRTAANALTPAASVAASTATPVTDGTNPAQAKRYKRRTPKSHKVKRSKNKGT